MLKSFFFTSILYLLISSVVLADKINKINFNGNERISDETIILFGEIDVNKDFNDNELNLILKRLYRYNCRNLLIEGGDSLTSHLLKNKIFNKFYLYKSPKNLSKETDYLKFNSLDVLKKNYKNKLNLKQFLGKDKITLYKN